jgi:hypothetical protein
MPREDAIPPDRFEIKPDELPPKVAALYFLMRAGVCVYVGQSSHVIERIRQHVEESAGVYYCAEPKLFDTVHYVPCESADLGRLEREYIARLDPEYNTSSGGNGCARAKKAPAVPAALRHHQMLQELRDQSHSILQHTDEPSVGAGDLFQRAYSRLEYEITLRDGAAQARESLRTVNNLVLGRFIRVIRDDPRMEFEPGTWMVRLRRCGP